MSWLGRLRPGLDRLLVLGFFFTAAALIFPGVASAHAANIEYNFPLPVWVYAVASAAAVFLTAPAAAIALRTKGDWTSRDFYRPISRLHLGSIGLVISSVLLLDALLGGAFGTPHDFTANPMTLIIWVDFWVGLGIVSAFIGNLWDFVSPLGAAGRALDRLLARRGISARAYPDWLGVWPSVVLLFGWSWAELIWIQGDFPHTLFVIALVYIAAQLVGMALFGAEVWLGRAELFTVVARTFSRFAPLEFSVDGADFECRARRCRGDDRIGCPSCFLEAPREKRRLRLRTYGSGVRREPPLDAGGGTFVVALLGTVVYDGLRGTNAYGRIIDAIAPNVSASSEIFGTLTMIVVVGGFALAYVGICALVSLREEGGAARIAERYAPTLIPIAAVYFAAHYFLYLFYLGQLTPGTLADPFEREWVPDYRPWTGVSGAVVWWIEVALIVWGHVVAVLEAHRVSLAHHRRPKLAFVAQLPLVALMVAYTFIGLWVLGQALAGE